MNLTKPTAFFSVREGLPPFPTISQLQQSYLRMNPQLTKPPDHIQGELALMLLSHFPRTTRFALVRIAHQEVRLQSVIVNYTVEYKSDN